MVRLIKWLKWLDNNILKLLFIGFIFLIPIYPKFPLQSIGYTYISIRVEDLYTAIMYGIFLIQLIRKKATINKNFLILFVLFWSAVFLSLIYGVYISKTLPYHQLAFLNAFRRIEYMSVFFIALSLIRTKQDFLKYLRVFLVILGFVSIYGIGQKFLGWPAVQTMNPAYAKGYLLFLTPEARISSTFSGHYDLAAYLVLLIPILLTVYLYKKKVIYFILFTIVLFTLVLTASRASYIAYLVSTFPLLLFLRKYKYIPLILALTLVFTFSSNTLTSRISRTFQIKQIFVNQETGQVVVPQTMSSKDLPAGSFYVKIKSATQSSQVIATNKYLAQQRIIDQLRDQARGEGRTLTSTQEAEMAASISALLRPINTVVADISMATRFQIEWPRAINAFLKNPLLGTGPSSITEATDNDYLRWLGEFGLFGTISFLLIFIYIIKIFLSYAIKSKDNNELLYWGFLFGFLALLINATYIDVFEASKVAFIFWCLTGIFIGPLLNKNIQK